MIPGEVPGYGGNMTPRINFRRLENRTSRHAFWEIWLESGDRDGYHDLFIRYGKIGTHGVTKQYSYRSKAAYAYLSERLTEKLNGDYVLCECGDSIARVKTADHVPLPSAVRHWVPPAPAAPPLVLRSAPSIQTDQKKQEGVDDDGYDYEAVNLMISEFL